jgi:hypothetical protein
MDAGLKLLVQPRCFDQVGTVRIADEHFLYLRMTDRIA